MSIEETRRSFLRNKCLAAAATASGAFVAMASRLGQASTPQGTSRALRTIIVDDGERKFDRLLCTQP